MDPALAEFERNRREYINTMKRIRLENPDITPAELELRAREEIMSKGPKSRAYYRYVPHLLLAKLNTSCTKNTMIFTTLQNASYPQIGWQDQGRS